MYGFTVSGKSISWRLSLEKIVALPSTKSKYIALWEVEKEANIVEGLTNELDFEQRAVNMYCNSHSAIDLVKSDVFHERTKHVR